MSCLSLSASVNRCEDNLLKSVHRRNEIITAIRNVGTVSVDELTHTYGVSVGNNPPRPSYFR